jgi:hypothetical protein
MAGETYFSSGEKDNYKATIRKPQVHATLTMIQLSSSAISFTIGNIFHFYCKLRIGIEDNGTQSNPNGLWLIN